jgi:toxin ParE1/3/4
MKVKPVVLRDLARQDVDEAIDNYLLDGAAQAALNFVDALEKAYRHIARYPASGSPRYAHELDISELRGWPIQRSPFIIFYVEQSDHVDVWRVLHGRRDIPAWLLED